MQKHAVVSASSAGKVFPVMPAFASEKHLRTTADWYAKGS